MQLFLGIFTGSVFTRSLRLCYYSNGRPIPPGKERMPIMMTCPGCGAEITKLIRKCGGCKADFGPVLYDKFAFYFGLQEELRKLTDLQNSLFAGIANVTARIERYEEIIRHDLASLRLAEAPVAPGARQKKKKR